MPSTVPSPTLRLLRPLAALVGDRLEFGVAVLCDATAGTIVAVGSADTLRSEAARDADTDAEVEVVDLPDRVLLPAPVNVHSHAFQILLRGRADDAPSFRRWVDDHMYPLVLSLDAEDLESASLLAFAEMALAGIASVGEFFYLHNAQGTCARLGAEQDLLVARAARRVGLRTTVCRALYDGAGHPARERFRESVDEAVVATRALAEALAGDPLARGLPAPHSLHGASEAMLQAGHALAGELDAPLHIHLAEQEHDLAFARERYGTTPLRALARLGLVDHRLVCVHGVWLDEEEWTMLGAARGGLAYNPSANMFLGDGVTALETAVRAGVTVALGCDGPGGNNRLDPFEEMRLAELLQRVTQRRMGVLTGALPADVCPPFTMATQNGARLLGYEGGLLAAGHAADVIAIDPAEPSVGPLPAPLEAAALLRNLVYAGQSRAFVTDVFAGGRDLVRARRLVTVDATELASRAARLGAPRL